MYTVPQLAQKLGVHEWQIRRMFKRGFAPQPRRLGNYRVISDQDLPQIEEGLRKAGYLTAA